MTFKRSFSTCFGIYTGFGHQTSSTWQPTSYPLVANVRSNTDFYLARNDGTTVPSYWIALGSA